MTRAAPLTAPRPRASRRKGAPLALACLLAAGIPTPGPATREARAAADDFAKETVRSTPLGSGLHMLEGAGGNVTALVGPEGTLLVDADFAPMAGKLVARLRELGGTSPRFVVNTHFHYDHAGGNEVLGATALLIAATAVRERLASPQVLWKETHPPFPARAWPALTFDGTLTLHLNGEEIRVVHLPSGHTDGDTVVFFEKGKVASLGDLCFAGMYPIFHPEHAGSLEGYLANLERVLARLPEDARVVPGHGPLSTKADLRRYVAMIRASVAVVEGGIAKGLPLEAMQKAGLPAEWASFSHGYLKTERWIANLHAALSAARTPPGRSPGR